MTIGPYTAVTDAQRRFVLGRGAALDNRGWAVDHNQNLFAPLHPDTVLDFKVAGEITASGAGRIAAPHSSTALAINMFDVWRGVSLEPLRGALQVDVHQVLGYEKEHGFGFRRGAQPDIEFVTNSGEHVAVEVKLREPYGSVTNEFADRYFDTPGLWDGLPALHDLAVNIRDGGATFATLHAAQLIKHALGLTHSYGSNFVLGYLWHHVPSETGDRHISELNEFTAIASRDINFTSVTVVDLLDRLDRQQVGAAWHDYMVDRYVMPAGP